MFASSIRPHPLALFSLLAWLAWGTARAGDPVPPTPAAPVTHADPYLPPAQRRPAPEPAASGAELQEQAVQKLRRRFEQADLDASGSLTQEEAQRAGLGFVAKHFDQIDRGHRGLVSFEDLQVFLAQRRKEADSSR